MESHDAGLRLTLRTDFRGRVERREFVAPSCDELSEAAAILLAVALEPELSGAHPIGPPAVPASPKHEPAGEPTPPTLVGSSTPESTPTEIEPLDEPAVPESSPAPRDDPSPEPTRDRPSVRLRLGAAAEAGSLPKITGGPRLAIGLSWHRTRLELHGGYLAPTLGDTENPVVRYQAGVVGLRGCRRPRIRRVEFPLCGGLEGGAIRASPLGPTHTRTRHGPWLGPLASMGVAARWGRVGTWASMEAVIPLLSGEFLLDGEVAFRRSPVSGRLVFGLEIIIP